MQKKTLIMGILNITPDSFSDGGDYYNNPKKAVTRVKEMLKQGADIIDIGGESLRPGSETITAQEEISRVIPVIIAIKNSLGNTVRLSIDTWKHTVAEEALRAGCTVVNSMGGFHFDKKMADVIASFGCQVVIYHIRGEPKTMQQGLITYTDVVKDICHFFTQQIALGKKQGIAQERFIIDPGIGFGKTLEQNLEIIKRLNEFYPLNIPLLIGVSRKSHLGMLFKQKLNRETTPHERLEGALAETAIAVYNGAAIVRTHDIWETKKFLTVLDNLL